jgi:hypothetical protein
VIIYKFDVIKMQISYHTHNMKSAHADYIYLIISSKKQKGKPGEMDLPFLKTISHVFYGHERCIFIAVTYNRDSLHVRWRYLIFNARNHKTAKASGCSWSVDYEVSCLFLPYR